MERLRGRGLGAGMALGTSAVVRVHNGIPMLPEAPPRFLAEQAKRRSTEPPDVILVADDYRVAQSVRASLTWGRVVGIVAGMAAPDTPVPDLPTVVDVSGLAERVQNDVLLLVDAERGLALLDPDAMAVAQYQAEAEHIAPKRRLFLDDAHLPAQTLDGRTIQVIAELDEKAVEAGADALYVTLEAEEVIFSNETPTAEQKLENALRIAAGKPLIVSWEGSVAPETLLQATAQIDLTVAVPVREDREVVAQLAVALNEAEHVCQEREVRYSRPRLAAQILRMLEVDWPDDPEQDSLLVESLIEQGASRLFFFLDAFHATQLRRFETMVSAAASALVPVYVCLSHFSPSIFSAEKKKGSRVRLLIGTGVSGFFFIAVEGQHETIQELKQIIRETNAAECREALLQRLSATD